MIIRWQVEDGYAGGSRPQETDVCDEDLENCETDEERDRVITDAIQEDFEGRITWCRL